MSIVLPRRAALALPALLPWALGACATAEGAAPRTGSGAAAAALVIPDPITQGMLAVGRAAPGTRITLDGRPVAVGPDGTFAFGLPRDAGPEAVLSITPPGARAAETRRLAVAPREWDVQRISGLPGRQVTPEATDLARIRAEQERLNAARARETPEALFAGGFDWPARGRISGRWGAQRVLNGQPRAPHLGLDIAAPTGTPVATMTPGRVVLAADLYFTGLTVVVEHGLGVSSLYAHLSRIDVRENEAVARGATIGAVGSTGRSTGPHLHLGMFWRGVPVDPGSVLSPG